MYKTVSLFSLLALMSAFAGAAEKPGKVDYFSCTVKEKVKVTVKFAVKGLDLFKKKAQLVAYPGASEETGPVLVTPEWIGKSVAMMTNLNAQGGDLRVEHNSIKLYGDGDGYEFTDLVVWDLDTEENTLEGYVRDYGSAYSNSPKKSFKQFIECQRSSKIL